jgi:hypothetical protein
MKYGEIFFSWLAPYTARIMVIIRYSALLLAQKDALLPLPFSFALEFTVWKIQENQEGSALNATYQHLVFVDEIGVLARTQIP